MNKNPQPTTIFEESPWRATTARTAPARRVTVEVTRAHVESARWRRFQDPVSLAVHDHLADHACAEVFWNSDSFGPRHAQDDARIGIHVETQDQDGTVNGEEHYYTPLPRRTARAMWKLSQEGIDTFRTFRTAVQLPLAALGTDPPSRLTRQ